MTTHRYYGVPIRQGGGVRNICEEDGSSWKFYPLFLTDVPPPTPTVSFSPFSLGFLWLCWMVGGASWERYGVCGFGDPDSPRQGGICNHHTPCWRVHLLDWGLGVGPANIILQLSEMGEPCPVIVCSGSAHQHNCYFIPHSGGSLVKNGGHNPFLGCRRSHLLLGEPKYGLGSEPHWKAASAHYPAF